MSDDPVLVERRSSIAIVTLNDPKTRNALSGPVIDGLADFLESVADDRSLGCIVLTGAGDGFCSGGNVADMLTRAHAMFRGSPYDMQEGYRDHIQRVPRAFERVDVPVIAAVNGAAIGVGCDLACMCDIRIAAEEAKFAESFLRVGLVSGDGGAWHLPRVIGLPRAMDMSLTCTLIDSARAKKWGLVSRVVPRASLLDEAIAMADKIAAFPLAATRLNKRLIRRSGEVGLLDSLQIAAARQEGVAASVVPGEP